MSAPPEPRCPRCGAAHEPDQEYCLECGLRLPGAAWADGSGWRSEAWTRESPAWLWAALLASLLVALVAGAIVAVAATRDDEERPGGAAAPAGTDTGSGPVLTGAGTITLEPPTITIEPPETGELPPIDTLEPDGPVGDWPAGTVGYTIVLASIERSRGRGPAEQAADRAAAQGLPETGVLDSSRYASLREGYWVAFSGVYTTLAEARAALGEARGAGFPLAYVREIRP